jgi:hypothetical protein
MLPASALAFIGRMNLSSRKGLSTEVWLAYLEALPVIVNYIYPAEAAQVKPQI